MREKGNPKTYTSKRNSLIKKHGKPPKDQGPWFAVTSEMLSSRAFLSLNGNEAKALFRIILEHLYHGGFENGNLICTHEDFMRAGVGRDRVADSIAGLEFKGFISTIHGRGGHGSTYPNTYRLTLAPDFEGARPTHEWRKISEEDCLEWKREGGARAKAAAKRKREHARKRNRK